MPHLMPMLMPISPYEKPCFGGLMKYGNANLSGKFLLGPMAGYTDIAYRLLCRKQGAAMCFTEFSNASAILRGSEKTWELMKTCKKEMPVGIQIFGSDEKQMASACKKISEKVKNGELFACCIDINLGCPSYSVTRAQAGSALLKKPEKAASIVKACVKASEIPITAKIRAGWSKDNAVKTAKALEKAGLEGITVHWRTATEGRKRNKGWQTVAKVKQALEIPVIGNGGATTPELAVQFLSETKCDAVMICTGALGNPRIFRQANQLLKEKGIKPEKLKQRLSYFHEYCSLAENLGILTPKRLKAHAMEFLTGFAGATKARKRLNSAKTEDEISAIIAEFSGNR